MYYMEVSSDFDKEKVPEEINALREKIMKEYEENEKMPKKKRILFNRMPKQRSTYESC